MKRVAHVVFPRTDPVRPVLGFVWDAITALRDLSGIEVEVLIPLPVRAVRRSQSFARRLRNAGSWPSDIEEKLRALDPRPVLVPYLPLPNRTIEAAATAIALSLIAREPEKRPRALHGSFLDEGGFAAAIAARAIGARSIAVAHGSDVRAALGALDEGRRRRASFTVRHADRLLAVSNFLAAELAQLGGRAEVVRYSTYASRHPLAEANAPKNEVLFAGRIGAEKGVAVLLDAIALLPAEVRLTLVGPHAPGFDIHAEAQKRGIAARVKIEPERPQAELNVLYANASCTVLPSLHEGFGIVLVESLLVGRPVVGADVGGIREIVNAENGALAAAGDAHALAKAIKNVLARSYDPQRLRASAMSMTWDRAAVQLARVTREVIEE